MSYSYARILARKLRKKLNLATPVDMESVMSELGVLIKRLPEGETYGTLPKSVDAVFLPVREEIAKNGLILLKETDNKNRERFTLAHELYHVLHAPKNPTCSFFHNTKDNKLLHRHEREANIFASEFLMPADEVRQAYASGIKGVSKLAELFGVSKSAMEIRLKELFGEEIFADPLS